MLKLFHDEIREMNDEVCGYFNEKQIDSNSSYLVTQRLCEAAFWLHQLYYVMLDEENKNIPQVKPLKIVKDDDVNS